jgi:acyl-CoA synthetase (AMP-forming)/AMP-acid ligase II
MTLEDIVRATLLRRGDEPLVTDGDEELSYADIHAAAATIATYAKECGTSGRPPHIAALMDNRWEYFATDLACAAFGCVLVRLNARDAVADIAWILANSETTVLLYGAERAEQARRLRAGARRRLRRGVRGTARLQGPPFPGRPAGSSRRA